MKPTIAIVTGGSSGIGLETARALRARGVTVYALSRRPAEGEHLCCDVSDAQAVRAAVDEVLDRPAGQLRRHGHLRRDGVHAGRGRPQAHGS